ncbi:protein-L-isoaspartate O-methyltransferase [Pelagerythrobacter sp.]|uniref:protein-L-isoaspartate O-methyltransferase family protein n=1 Tax=Pelagerythrobacter sp. TaxID=2800702 RepID=UPI0035B088C2
MTLAETPTAPDGTPAIEHAAARRAMIDSQLRTSGVSDTFVLERMRTVPREDHVPPSARGVAYMDRAIALDGGGYIAAPVFYGALLREARPGPDDSVLMVDGGSGYLPALLAPLAGSVKVVTPEEATGSLRGKFSLILVDGAVEVFPDTLAKRLADNARVVTGLIENGVTRLAIGRPAGDGIGWWRLAEMGIPRLPGFDAPKRWSF